MLAAISCLGIGIAEAKVYKVTIVNHLHQRIVGVSIVGSNSKGKVVDFQPTSEERFELKVDLPDDSVCNPVVRFRLPSHYRATLRVPLCQGGEYVLSWR
jgi:hypothetical protein